MERLVIVVVVAIVAVAVALVVQRRQPAAAPVRTGYNVPGQLHRPDFTRPDAAWLVVVFSSATCETCAGVWDKVQVLGSDAVAGQRDDPCGHASTLRSYSAIAPRCSSRKPSWSSPFIRQ